MMMKNLLILSTLSLFFCFQSLPAQEGESESYRYGSPDTLQTSPLAGNEPTKPSPWSYNLSVGSAFSYIPGIGSFTGMYAAPHMNYAANNRLTFHTGMMVSQTFPMFGTPGMVQNQIQPQVSLSMFVAASYRLSENLVVYGTGMKYMMPPGLQNNEANFLMDDFSVGAAYSIGNFTIGASFHNRTHTPLWPSPFSPMPGFSQSPFYR